MVNVDCQLDSIWSHLRDIPPGISLRDCLGFLFLCFLVWLGLVFQVRLSLSNPGCDGTHSEDQASLKLRDLSVTCLCLPRAGIKGVPCHHLAEHCLDRSVNMKVPTWGPGFIEGGSA